MTLLATFCYTVAVCLAGRAGPVPGPSGAESVTALVGATVIDGNGGAPLQNGTVLIVGSRISKVGPSKTVEVPAGARVLDVRGKYVIPGLIDVNVHLTPYSAPDSSVEWMSADVVRAVRELAAHGVTTVRDSYGLLDPLLLAKDSLRGDLTAARLLVAGNILGWGDLSTYSNLGPYASMVAERTARADAGKPARREPRVDIVQGMGENLIGLDASSLRPLLSAYLDKGVDFIKIGVTTHVGMPPVFLLFSPRALETMVQEAHRRGKKVDAHAVSTEGLRMAVLAGVDVVQHPEILGGYPMPPGLATLLAERGVVCAIIAANITGPNWMERRAGPAMQHRERENAKQLIDRGCRMAVASDDYPSNIDHWSPDTRAPSGSSVADGDSLQAARRAHVWGKATLASVEGLVELGMTPSQAITAATRNGAIAAGALREYGTLTAGKRADVVVLDASPLESIRNIRKVVMVLRDGRIVPRAR